MEMESISVKVYMRSNDRLYRERKNFMKKPIIRLAVVVSLLAIALSSLFVLLPTFAAGMHTQQAHATHPRSVFALEHQVGKIGAGAHQSALTFNCNPPSKSPIINVVERVRNDADSGQSGDTWALDIFTRSIKVWNMGSSTYCAVVMYSQATFQAVSGNTSPGTGGVLTGDEHGNFSGGYQTMTFPGTLSVSDPSHWPLKGKVINPYGGDVVDYQCPAVPNPTCPGFIDWFAKYFSDVNGSNVSLAQWGWTYTAADSRDGIWVNASTGNSGDILDVD
jgi:hypothetical protein